MFTLLTNPLQTSKTNSPHTTSKVLEMAYELYLKAPQVTHPLINLKELSQRADVSVLECRNIIVKANKAGRFPDCSLSS